MVSAGLKYKIQKTCWKKKIRRLAGKHSAAALLEGSKHRQKVTFVCYVIFQHSLRYSFLQTVIH